MSKAIQESIGGAVRAKACAHAWQLLAPVVATPRIDTHLLTLTDSEEPEAVVLDLVGPLRAGRHGAVDGRQAGLDEQGGHCCFQGPGLCRGLGATAGCYHNARLARSTPLPDATD